MPAGADTGRGVGIVPPVTDRKSMRNTFDKIEDFPPPTPDGKLVYLTLNRWSVREFRAVDGKWVPGAILYPASKC